MCQDLDESIVCCETEQAMNSRECSEIVFNNGYTVIIMDSSSSSMMDNILQPSINTVKHLIYYYFSTTFEVSKLDIIANLKLNVMSNKLLKYMQSWLYVVTLLHGHNMFKRALIL